MSAKRKFDFGDLKSAIRHAVIPLVGGAAVAGLEVAQAGQFDPKQIRTAVITALIAGVIRALQRWTADIQK